MHITFREGYIIFTLILVMIDGMMAFMAYGKRTPVGKYMGRSAVFAALVAVSYLISILDTDYMGASIMSSLYFISIDWLLITMIKFAIVFTSRKEPNRRRIMLVLELTAVLDTIILAINPLKEIAVHYVWRPTVIACFKYSMMPLYYCHLTFTYLMVLAVLGILLYKAIHTPIHYRGQYVLLAAAIFTVVLINAVFLLPSIGRMSIFGLIDSSIAGYSIGLIIMYWGCFRYASGYLRHGLAEVVLDNFDQGVLLFDYDEHLVMKNERALEMIPALKSYEKHPDKLTVQQFLKICGIPLSRHITGSRYSIQFFAGSEGIQENSLGSDDYFESKVNAHVTSETNDVSENENWSAGYEDVSAASTSRADHKGIQLRCDYTRLDDEEHHRIGDLFVFTAATEEIDPMTGYHSFSHFRQFIKENPDTFRHPCAVAEFDINGLTHINRINGQDEGDRLIRNLAELIRQCMPEETYYVRGYDAHLIAISYFAAEEEMIEYGSEVAERFEHPIEVGYSSSETEDTDILALIAAASRAMMIKKLLDNDSARSQTLSSLVRALKESDSDTEAHVKRTQNMGRQLGVRFGLSDLEQCQLSLLCLLHDIGKVGIPLEILNKPGRLSEEEYAVLKTHAEKGYQIASSSWELHDIADMILYHHERWDGHGYPKGLHGDEIPFLSRMIAVVDSYDAMVSNRSYRKGRSPEEAQGEMIRCSGMQFDPDIVGEFLKMLEENPDIAKDSTSGSAEVIETRGTTGHGLDISAITGYTGAGPDREASDLPHVSSHPVDYCRYIMNIDDYIISVDENFEAFTGYSSEDVNSGRLRQMNLIPEEDRNTYFTEVEKQLDRGNAVYMEHYILRKDGSRIYVFCYGRKFYHSASKTLRTEVVIVDLAKTRIAAGRLTLDDIDREYNSNRKDDLH